VQVRIEILFFFVAAVVVYLAAKFLRPVFLNIGLEKNYCPNCGSSYIRKSSPRKYADFPYRLLRLRPFRCAHCEVRFYAFREPSEAATPSGQSRPAGMHQ
jgi:hypothetical protein